ncbi:hypothetical protein, partial [Streptomyces zhihengii]
AGVDVRTANWQRSKTVTLLGLDRSASRMELLAAVRERGLLAGVRVVPDPPGLVVPAVPPAGSGRQRGEGRVTLLATTASPTADSNKGLAADTTSTPTATPVPVLRPVRIPTPRRGHYTAIPGQLALDDALAPVHHLPARHTLGAAA